MNQATITKSVLKRSKRFIMYGAPILDVGVRRSELIKKLAEKHEGCFGINLFAENGCFKNGTFKYGDMTDICLADCSVGTLFCTDVIKRLSEIELDSVISEMFRVLAPGGHAIITTDDQIFTEARIRELFGEFEIVKIKFHKKDLLFVARKNQ